MAARKLMTMFGMTGAVGQAAILIHSLVDCYPYKMMSNPSYRFREGIAYGGLLLESPPRFRGNVL